MQHARVVPLKVESPFARGLNLPLQGESRAIQRATQRVIQDGLGIGKRGEKGGRGGGKI